MSHVISDATTRGPGTTPRAAFSPWPSHAIVVGGCLRHWRPCHAAPERGAALVVALILMLVLTVLGVSGMKMATLELTMAGNSQAQQQAFQAAETGIAIALAHGSFTTIEETAISDADLGHGAKATDISIQFKATTPVPDIAFSMGSGSSSVQAFHFAAHSTGVGPRGAEASHTQGFYIIGPGGP